MTTAHTPTPWTTHQRVRPGRGAITFKTVIVDADQNEVCEVYGETKAEAAAIARYIVDCCNTNESRDIRAALERGEGYESDGDRAFRAALAAAKTTKE
jgi:hypothetical protein